VLAVTFQEPGRVALEERPDPEPLAPDDAVVKIDASGICGSDLHIYHGRVQIEPGFIIGHEYVGTVAAKGDAVAGVTTAATLWLVTVIGLCLGGGQLILGSIATALGVVTLWFLKWVDVLIPREHRARIVIVAEDNWRLVTELPRLAAKRRCYARFQQRTPSLEPGKCEFAFELRWKLPERSAPPIEWLQEMNEQYVVTSFELTTENGR